jgi:hypothetical protein
MNESERRQPPLPRAQAFVVCRDILEDCRSHDFVLIAPFSTLNIETFPVAARMSIYADLTCGHGAYAMTLQLLDDADDELWRWDWPQTIRLENPLVYHLLTLYDAVLELPEPGRYDLVLLANGSELARHALYARALANPSGAK